MAITLFTLPDRLESCRARLEADPLSAGAAGELQTALNSGGSKPAVMAALKESCEILDCESFNQAAIPSLKSLGKAEHEALVVHPREKQERRHKLASLLGRVLHLLQGDLVAKTVTRVTELATDSAYPKLDSANRACAAFLGIQPPKVYITRGEEPFFTAMLDRDAFICAHHDFVAESARKLSESQLRFAVAHQQEHIKNGHAALLQISPERLEALMLDQIPFLFRTPIQLASKAVGLSRANLAAKKIGDWLPDNSRTAKVFETVGDILPDKDQETILPEMVHDWVRGWIQGVEYSADRAGFLACGSLTSAVTAIAATTPELCGLWAKGGTVRNRIVDSEKLDRAAADRIREILRFSVSREYLGFVSK